MSSSDKRTNFRIVALLLLLQLLSVYFLWTVNSVTPASEAIFGLFLAVDLVSFSMISYVYRLDKRGERVSRSKLFAGCCMVLLLLFGSLFV